ncbi:MAG: 5-methyltetrahydropteroyltriglutamate--homocysteine methyltransferase [Enterobacter kobei]|nr:5-methyltetrahydropteroyltriglutamate--homocysteine methyltransferase [Enterobacter kobei]
MDEALALGHNVKPVLLGPVTYLWLGKVKGEPFDRLNLLADILPVYQQVLGELAKRGAGLRCTHRTGQTAADHLF